MSNTQNNTQAQANAESNYINCITQGIGYLNRVREVTVKKGSFLAGTINMMYGEKGVKDGVQTTTYDVKAVNQQTEDVLRQFMADSNDQGKVVIVRCSVGDAYIDSYTIKNGPKAGQLGLTMKGRVLKITHVWAKAKGADDTKLELVYELPVVAPAVSEAEQSAEARTGTQG